MHINYKKLLQKNYTYFLAGVLLTLSLPPFYLFPLGILAIYIFYQSAFEKEPIKKSFLFGFGFFLTSLYWIKNSILIAGADFYWLIPFALIGIPAFLSLFFCLKIILFRLAIKITKNELVRIVLFSTIWLMVEVFRGNFLGGFPWSLVGYSFLAYLPLAQLSFLISVYGLGFVFVLLSLLLFSKIKFRYYIFATILALQLGFGFYHINYVESKSLPTIYVVQPNIGQELKNSPATHLANTNRVLEMLAEIALKDKSTKIIILPEAVFPYILEQEQELREKLASYLSENSFLVLGSTRVEYPKFYNAVEVLDYKGKITNYYNKRKLVPFGEFVPFREILPFINKLTPGENDFSSGSGLKTIGFYGIKATFSPIICYEAIFPYEIIDKNNQPDFIINVTNDGWFGDSIGPKQHLAFSQMRAIEENLYFFRSANTGISAIINTNGMLIKKIPYGKAGIIKL